MRLPLSVAFWLLVVLSGGFAANGTAAQGTVEVRSKKVEAAVAKWAADNNIKRYSLAVGHKGRIVHKAAADQTTEAPAPLASLSKSITGACVLALEKAGLFSRDDSLKAVLGAGHRLLSKSSKSNKITIAQLLTHSSGLKPDTTQGRMQNWMFAKSNRIQKRAKEGLAANAIAGESGAFFYNNSNYFVLGAVIEHVTGKRYETACPDALPYLKELPSLKLSKKWFAIGPGGGWEANTSDFLSFALKNYGQGTTGQSGKWTLPSIDVGGGAFYGPGVFYRKNRSKGHNVWHSGLLCLPDKNDDIGSFFAIWGGEWSAAVTYKKCTTFKQMIALDNALATAALR